MKYRILILAALTAALAGCGRSPDASVDADGSVTDVATPLARWYSFEQVSRGARVFAENCASCHGEDASGASDWRRRTADGTYPAPPLNGSGHGWHHPLGMLFGVIKHGSPGGSGNMPAWGGKLSDEEILAAVAWFQSRWPEDIYRSWTRIDKRARND